MARTTLVFYLLIGAAVAVAAWLRRDRGAERAAERVFRLAASVVFWPIYLPAVLAGGGAAPATAPDRGMPRSEPRDAMHERIAQVERELSTAFEGLGGWAGEALANEAVRLRELRGALRAQAERIREMDRILAGLPAAPGADGGGSERAQRAAQAWRDNVQRLAAARERSFGELMDTLAWIRELVSMIHLARFTGAPASRAEELVRQIASAVEGLAEASVLTRDDSAAGRALP